MFFLSPQRSARPLVAPSIYFSSAACRVVLSDADWRAQFARIAVGMKSVIVCRASPRQKVRVHI